MDLVRLSLTRGAAGELFVADRFTDTIRRLANGAVTTIAGQPWNASTVDGAGTAASIFQPRSIALGQQGRLYIGDSNFDGNSLRVMAPGGAVTTLAGSPFNTGSWDGVGAGAAFYNLLGIAVAPGGDVFVVEGRGGHTVRRVTPAGAVSTFAGLNHVGGYVDAAGSAARFDALVGVAVAPDGSLYVTEHEAHTVRKISPTGVVSTFAGVRGMAGSADGNGAAARFNRPAGVAVDASGNVYVADFGNSTIRRISPAGDVTTLLGVAGQQGTADGNAVDARLHTPFGIAVNAAGTLIHVTDANAIREIRAKPCTAAASCAGLVAAPSLLSFRRQGGVQQVFVSAPASCQWQASTTSSWLGVGVASGTGNGLVPVQADPLRLFGGARIGRVVVGGPGSSSPVTVYQH